MRHIKRAHISQGWLLISSSLLLAAVAAWLSRHIIEIVATEELSAGQLNLLWFISFLLIAWTSLLAILERPKRANSNQINALNELNVAVLIPAYNEDADLLRGCIQSMLDQTRKPNQIIVVDDGSTAVDYTPVKQWLKTVTDDHVTLSWFKTANGGKRHAQAVGMKYATNADIFVTVDSDTILDPKAIHEGLLPFADGRIQSVGGVCLPLNVNENLLTRFTGLWETVWQLVDRSAQSTMSCVTVNSGVLAFYRAATIRRYLDGYLSETFFGRPVKFSDDSLLTMYSMQHGKTVQQPTSLCFSAVPNKYSHHIRRYTRWMRGSFIRTWWRFKYLPMSGYAYWLHLVRWCQFALSTFIIVYLALQGTLTNPDLIPYLIAVPIVISYMTSLRYFIVRRNDVSFGSEVLTYMTAPIVMLWALLVLRFVKYYAYATVLNTGWGTRSKVEVGLTKEAV